MLREIKSESKSNYIRKFQHPPTTTYIPRLISLRRWPLHSFSTCAYCSQQNHYKTLGLEKNATAGQIKSKFYELSRIHHPDMNPSSSGATDRFKQISEAYTFLSDHNLRQQYDQTLSNSFSPYTNTTGTYASMSSNYSTGNATRRQNANYAWSTRKSRTNLRSDSTGREDPLSGKTPMEEFSATLNRFERLARRKKATATASSSRTFTDPWLDPSSTHKSASTAKQTVQLAFMLSFIFWIGSKFPF